MKTIGLIGGMSWESTVKYYQFINEAVKKQLGGLHSAKIILYSVDFYEIEKLQSQGEWEKCGSIMASAAKHLEGAGADFIVICTNTMHKVVPQMQSRIHIPILHIAEATAKKLHEKGITRTALLGTIYTMKQDFYKEKLIEDGIEVLIPEEKDMERVNQIIFDELCLGVVSEKSQKEILAVMDRLAEKGAQGVILGCTELGLIIKQENTLLPVFDTTQIHAEKAALSALFQEDAENPWKRINLDDYENHMKLDSVLQLQAMNDMMKNQLYRHPVSSVMILGVAGGNGLNHIDPDKITTVYGVDINNDYLDECVRRHPALKQVFVPVYADLQAEDVILPKTDLVVANLLIEYIGYENFQRAIRTVSPSYVSCIIQINTSASFVSDSPYLHVFDGLEKFHHQMEENELTQVVGEIGYRFVYKEEKELPNGKKLVQLDYQLSDKER